jgi:hypothetical protein
MQTAIDTTNKAKAQVRFMWKSAPAPVFKTGTFNRSVQG